MTKYTLEQLENASLEWPNDVRDQISNDLNIYIDDEDCDWLNLTWKKTSIQLDDLSMFSINQKNATAAMLLSYRVGTNFYKIENDTARHEFLKIYILENGTWPSPMIVTSDKFGWTIKDGQHRFIQALNVKSILDMKKNLNHPVIDKQFQNYVNQLNDTHEIWLGESKIN